MKKILLLLIALITFVPFSIKAGEDDVAQFYIDADIDIAGSMNVRELIVVDGPLLNGYFRGVTYASQTLSSWAKGNIDFKNSSIYNGSGIDNVSIKAKYITGSVSFDTFKDDDFEELKYSAFASNGQKGLYTTSAMNYGTEYKMYYPASDSQKVAFLVTYTITNVAVIHEDVAEVYWQFVGTDFIDPIRDLKIRLILPYSDNSDDFRFWAHGDVEGEITQVVDNSNINIGVLTSIKNLTSSGKVDIRMIFDKDIIQIQNFNNHSEQEAKEKILEVEQERADEADKQRAAMRARYNTVLTGCIIYIIVLIILWVYIYIKFDKEHQSNFKLKYYRDFIDDYSVETIDYLLNKSITPNAMSASIMNLIYKKNIFVEEIPTSKNKKEYKFTLKNKKEMTDNELYLTKFLFEKVGKDNSFTTKELKTYASGTNTYSKFTSNYETWKTKVLKEGKSQGFFESNTKFKVIGIVYGIVGILMFALGNSVVLEQWWLPSVVLILAIIFLGYTILFTKRTLKGNDHFLKWKAFKNFLNDFSILDERELPEVVLWERYMVYAVILGVADKVQKAMNVRINEIDPNMTTYTYSPTFNMYMHMNLSRTINSSINNAVQQAVTKAAAQSSSSSGGGFGGGFSSGGGFGGGGGGTGGRF